MSVFLTPVTARPLSTGWKGSQAQLSPATWRGRADAAAGRPHSHGVPTFDGGSIDEGAMDAGRGPGQWVRRWRDSCHDY